jgi:hypothetical protein
MSEQVHETVHEGVVVHREQRVGIIDGVEIWWTWDPVAGNLSDVRVNGRTVVGMLPSSQIAAYSAEAVAATLKWCARACEDSATAVETGEDDLRGQGGRDAVLAMARYFSPAPTTEEG